MAKAKETTKSLMQVEGIGPLTATALVTTVGDIREFKNGLQFAAWLGLVPRQWSSGGKSGHERITKRAVKPHMSTYKLLQYEVSPYKMLRSGTRP